MSDDAKRSEESVVFGEVLFDHFADGSRVLGGAPFNVAWHLQGFGRSPLFVSAVGADETGREVLHRMTDWGMGPRGVQVDPGHPTGRVTATIVSGEPAFEIEAEQAYDHVRADALAEVVGDRAVSLIYHGTLALRHHRSREALGALRAAADAPTFIDLNLREPWWTAELVDSCLAAARWLKLNRGELGTVVGVATETPEACEEHARRLARERDLDAVIVTMGAHGSLMVGAEGHWRSESEPLPADEVVDTVGAGDAFSAVACMGLMEHWDPIDILCRGNAFAIELCRVRGATTQDRGMYERHLAAWEGT